MDPERAWAILERARATYLSLLRRKSAKKDERVLQLGETRSHGWGR